MRRFTDTAGRTWELSVTVGTIKRVRDLVGVDLYRLVDDSFRGLSELMADPVRLVDVLYCLCQGQAEAAKVTDEQFGQGLAGDVLAQASESFVEALIDFFPDARSRQNLRAVLEKGKAVRDRLMDLAETRLAGFDPQQAALSLVKRSSDSAGNSPAS
mgnify:CR=1 FL=1